MYLNERWDKVSILKGSVSVHDFAKFKGEEVTVKNQNYLSCEFESLW
jgi:hypothetical protein